MARLKIASPTLVIQSLDEADNALARIAECQRAIDSADIQLAADLDARKAQHATAIKPVSQELDNLKAALFQYATSNRASLFKDKNPSQGRSACLASASPPSW